jgi:SAM-dependent methyltransferase
MDRIRCYNCGNARSSFYDRENGYTLVKCNHCGLLYVNPRPPENEINRAAQTGVHRGDMELKVVGKYSAVKLKRYLRILSLVYPENTTVKEGASWLDIGSGYGEFIEALGVHFGKTLSIEGVEPNDFKRRFAISRNLSIHSMEYFGGKPKHDFISMLNVLSHLPDPIKAISGWKSLLRVDGEILLETGDTATLRPSDHPKPYLLPDHLSFASMDIVVEILRKCGFEIIAISHFRSPVYPELTFINLLKESYLLFRTLSLRQRYRFYPTNPNIDMWIRARRVD